MTALFGIAALLAIRLAVAEALFRQDNPGAIEQALAMQGALPSFARAENSAYDERLAALDAQRAGAALARAVRANPRASRAWTELGLAEEQSGNLEQAERALLQAAGADRQYLPAWTLANFYFRRMYFQHAGGDAFWRWARRAAALGSGDLAPLLQLCDQVEPDRFAQRLGETADLDRASLDFFIRSDRLHGAQLAAIQIAAQRDPADAPRLIDFADRQIRAGNGDAALEIWSALAAAKLIPFQRAGPLRPLTNGDLRLAPSGRGFDWRLLPVEGISPEWQNSSVTFSFSGSEPEAGQLLDQWLLLGARRYRLRFEYFAAGMPSPTGIRWTIAAAGGTAADRSRDSAESPPVSLSGAPLPAQTPAQIPEKQAAWAGAEWTFSLAHSSMHSILARIALIYRREPGTTRAGGSFAIRNLHLEAL